MIILWRRWGWELATGLDWGIWGLGIEIGFGTNGRYRGVMTQVGPALFSLERP